MTRAIVAVAPLPLLLLLLTGTVLSFVPSPPIRWTSSAVGQRHRHRVASSSHRLRQNHDRRRSEFSSSAPLKAGGFEWEDPTSDVADSGVENPYKNPDLLLRSSSSSEDSDDDGATTTRLKVDPARLLSPRLQGCNLYLVGMMGSGKSVVGDAIARRMGNYNFLDTDVILERATGMSINRIFETEGEESFRDAEAQVLDTVHAHVRCVIGTGGGLVLRNQNWSKLQTGLVLYLRVDPEVIYDRVRGNADRPLLRTDDPLGTIRRLIDERKGRYEQADVIVEVNADMDVTMTADACIRALHDFIDDNPPAWKKAKAKAQADGLDWV
jgi:shikimate kinase